MAQVFLVEAQPWDATTGQPVTVRLAGGGRRHYRHKGAADWIAGVVGVPATTSMLGFDGGFTGGGIPEVGAIGFMPATHAGRARIAGLVWTGAPIVVSSGDDAAADPAWTVALAGKVAGYTVQQGLFNFTVANLAGRLVDPLVTASFTGGGGLEGAAATAGRLKRRSWGRCWNVEGRALDPAANIFEFGDPAFPLRGFDAVKDKGRPGPVTLVEWAGTAAATLAALKAAQPPAGGAAAAPSIACVKWWTRPALLTADLRGEGGAGDGETVAGIAAAISAAAGGPTVDDLAAAIAARPEPAGLHVQDGETGVAALDRLLLRASMAWSVTPAGLLSIAPLALADPVATVTAAGPADREAVWAPVTRVSVGWRRNHRVQSAAEISAAVAAGEVTFADGQSVEDLKPRQPEADKTAENTAKDTAAVGGTPAGEVLAALAASKARQDALETATIPAIDAAIGAADMRITGARGAADAARSRADAAVAQIASEVTRIDDRIDAVAASGGYDDTALKAEVRRVDEAALGRDTALGRRVDSVSASVGDADTSLRALIRTTEEAAVGRETAISQRVDKIIADGGGSSEGVDSVARAEISRVEQASVARDSGLGRRVDTVETGLGTVDGRIAAKAQEVTSAYTGADKALADRSATLEAQMRGEAGSNLLSRVSASETALTDGRFATAQRAQGIEAAVGGVAARLGTVETATSDGRFAAAGAVSQLRTEYGGTAATVTRHEGAIVGLGQKTAAYVRVIADAGNGISQLSLWSDANGGSWELTGNGRINGNLTVDGTIFTRALAVGAVTSNVAAFGGGMTVSNGSTSEGASGTINATGNGNVRIDVSYFDRLAGMGSGGQAHLSIRRQTANGTGNLLFIELGKSTQAAPTSFFLLDTPPAGPVTYTITAASSGGDQLFWVAEDVISVMEWKR